MATWRRATLYIGYFFLFLVNSRVVLFKPVYSKDNRVVGKWYNIGPELFLVPIYVCYSAGGKRWILADVDYSRRESRNLRTA